MMYTLIDKKAYVKKVVCNIQNYFILSKNGILEWNSNKVFEGNQNSDIRICINSFYTFGDDINKFLGNFETNTIEQINYSFSSNCIWNEGVIVIENYRYDNEDGKVKGDYYILNFITNSKKLLLENIEGSIILIFNKNTKSIFRFNNMLSSLSLLTGKFEWETNLSGRSYSINNEAQEAKIISILGVYENHLLVWLEGDRLISIDTNNGTILYEILPFEGLVDVNGFQLWDFRDLFLEQETGKIIMLNKLFYYEIDILTQKVYQRKSFYTGNAYGLGRLPNMPEPPTDITFKKVVYTNDFIYFMGGYTFATNTVGVFNRKTYNIDWQESINLLETDNFNNLKEIQYANNKIYVLDTAGNLLIFEKE